MVRRSARSNRRRLWRVVLELDHLYAGQPLQELLLNYV
jgi:hypothetical protein